MKRKTQLSLTMSIVVFLLAVLLLSVSLVFVSCGSEPVPSGSTDSSSPEDSGSGGDDESPDDPGDLVVPDEPGVVIPDEPGDSGDEEGDEEVIADEDLFYVEEGILKLKTSVVLPDSFTLP
ncbi:MAG: hypothetical protein IJJ95_03955, partial [Spirochaetales bacterium]|nr:hypothetical protein [Spirochaetales bacterium]